MQGEQRDANGNLTSISQGDIPRRLNAPRRPTETLGLGPARRPSLWRSERPRSGFDTDTGGTTGLSTPPASSVARDIGGAPYRLEPGGTHADFGTDGILTWGAGSDRSRCRAASETYNATRASTTWSAADAGTADKRRSQLCALRARAARPYLDGSTAPGTFQRIAHRDLRAPGDHHGQFQAAMPDRPFDWTAHGTTSSSSFPRAQIHTGCAGRLHHPTTRVLSPARRRARGARLQHRGHEDRHRRRRLPKQ
jgi:hypothetical protein